jgi:hypothetical protein
MADVPKAKNVPSEKVPQRYKYATTGKPYSQPKGSTLPKSMRPHMRGRGK